MELLPTSNKKTKGKCPKCKKKVEAIIIEENFLRRDKCQCPSCHSVIYKCRVLGCENYALGSDSYDNELCSKCSKDLAGEVKDIYKTIKPIILPAAATGIAVAIANYAKNSFTEDKK